MNKNIRRIIALTLVISAYGAISPTTSEGYFNIGTKAVYASSYSPSSEELKSLSIKTTDGDTLSLRDGYNGDTVKLNDDKEYYLKITDDSNGIKINAEAKGDGYIVKIFTSDKSDAIAYNPADEIKLGKGNTTLYVRTYKSLSAYRKAKDTQNDVTICEQEYEINVMKTTGSSYEDETQDAIYLDKLEISKVSDISFLKQKTSYDIKVASSVSEIKITAQPEDTDDRVRIDGDLVTASDSYRKTVSLKNGTNEIKVKITDNKDNQRTYTLNVTRGSAVTQDAVYLENLKINEGTIEFSKDDTSYDIKLAESVNKLKITAEPEDRDYLVTINGKEVKYGDDYEKEIALDKGTNTVKVVVNDEINDKKRTYTLNVNRGTAGDSAEINTSDDKKPGWVQTEAGWKYNDATGNPLKNSWLFDKDSSVYCYLNEDGLRKIGWFKDKGNWYLLDSKGAMLTGWQEDGGKKYFLDSNGAMNTGWHKEDATNQDNTKTQNWYYLNSDGSMLTGWIGDGGKWYYLNKTGVMQTGWLIDSNSKYYLNESGVMVTGTKVIDGKTYKFASSGALII